MTDILKLARIQALVLILFVLNKFLLRPYVLKGDLPAFAEIFVFSFPNLCEAVIGTITITYIALVLRDKGFPGFANLSDKLLYLGVTLVAGTYVILQEFKIHNLGGRNVYDPYDVLFSIVGLIIAYGLLVLIKPRTTIDVSNT